MNDLTKELIKLAIEEVSNNSGTVIVNDNDTCTNIVVKMSTRGPHANKVILETA